MGPSPCWKSMRKYKRMIAKSGAVWYQGFEEMDDFFLYTAVNGCSRSVLTGSLAVMTLCLENLVLDKDGRMYLIDSEYSSL